MELKQQFEQLKKEKMAKYQVIKKIFCFFYKMNEGC